MVRRRTSSNQPSVQALEFKVVRIGNLRGVRLSWEETFKAMAHDREDWRDLDGTLNDGLDKEPW